MDRTLLIVYIVKSYSIYTHVQCKFWGDSKVKAVVFQWLFLWNIELFKWKPNTEAYTGIWSTIKLRTKLHIKFNRLDSYFIYNHTLDQKKSFSHFQKKTWINWCAACSLRPISISLQILSKIASPLFTPTRTLTPIMKEYKSQSATWMANMGCYLFKIST